MQVLLVKCPKCGNQQKTQPRGKYLGGKIKGKNLYKKKSCVYCGWTFNIYKNVNSHQIIKFSGIKDGEQNS